MNGGVCIAGNTLGLSKASGTNAPGILHSIGTFLTTNDLSVDNVPLPGWPAGPPGTTHDWTLNSSAAPLELPPGATVLHAELVWGGSYQYGTEDVTAFLGSAVTLAFGGSTLAVPPDPATQVTLGGTSICGGTNVRYYSRSATVTSFVATHGSGAYVVRGVPATQDHTVNALNAAGWCLIVAYANAAEPSRFVAIRVGAFYVDECDESNDAFTGFTTPSTGPIDVRLALAALEGDAVFTGDQVQVSDAGMNFHALATPNNPVNNFFASQINDRDGLLETSGTAGTLNHEASRGMNVSGARQGWDVTSVVATEAAGMIDHGQTQLTVRATSQNDNFVLVGIGLAVDAASTVSVTPGMRGGGFGLEPASPNPLRSNTRVRFSATRGDATHLRVVDVAGRPVRTLHHGRWPGGEGVREWDGRDAAGRAVPAGLYFITLEAEGHRRSTRIAVVR